MSQFARATFDVAGYLACRPIYPQRLYDIIYAYHAGGGGRFDRALDIGCGPGFIALELSKRFDHVLGVDPAKKMVDIGLQPSDLPTATAEDGRGENKIEYKVGSVEDLAGVGVGQGEGGVDLVVAGQAAHWFDYPKAWAALTRSVRRGGTVAFIGYAEMVFPSHPQLNHLITTHSSSPKALGPFWSQPGRSIVEGLLDRTPFPVPIPLTSSSIHSQVAAGSLQPSSFDISALPPLVEGGGHPVSTTISEPLPPLLSELQDVEGGWNPFTAVRLKSDLHSPFSPATSGFNRWLLTKTMTLSALEGYFRTWSSLHAYHERYPDDAARKGKGGKDGDIVDRLVSEVKEGLEKEGVKGLDEGTQFQVGWPLVLMMIKKKP